MWLRECCRQVEAEMIGYTTGTNFTKTCTLYFPAQYSLRMGLTLNFWCNINSPGMAYHACLSPFCADNPLPYISSRPSVMQFWGGRGNFPLSLPLPFLLIRKNFSRHISPFSSSSSNCGTVMARILLLFLHEQDLGTNTRRQPGKCRICKALYWAW